MDRQIKMVEELCDDASALVVEQKGRMQLLEQEYEHSKMLISSVLRDLKRKKHWVKSEAIEAQSVVAPPLGINLEGAKPTKKKKVELVAHYQSLLRQRWQYTKDSFADEEAKQNWMRNEEEKAKTYYGL